MERSLRWMMLADLISISFNTLAAKHHAFGTSYLIFSFARTVTLRGSVFLNVVA
jgi:hypothetical protein